MNLVNYKKNKPQEFLILGVFKIIPCALTSLFFGTHTTRKSNLMPADMHFFRLRTPQSNLAQNK